MWKYFAPIFWAIFFGVTQLWGTPALPSVAQTPADDFQTVTDKVAHDKRGFTYHLIHQTSSDQWRLIYQQMLGDVEKNRIVVGEGDLQPTSIPDSKSSPISNESMHIASNESSGVWLQYMYCSPNFCSLRSANILPDGSKINKTAEYNEHAAQFFIENNEDMIAYLDFHIPNRGVASKIIFFSKSENKFNAIDVDWPKNAYKQHVFFDATGDLNFVFPCSERLSCDITLATLLSSTKQITSTSITVPSNTQISNVLLTPNNALTFVTANDTLRLHTKSKDQNTIKTSTLKKDFLASLLFSSLNLSNEDLNSNLKLFSIQNHLYLVVNYGYQAFIAEISNGSYQPTSLIPNQVSELLLREMSRYHEFPNGIYPSRQASIRSFFVDGDTTIIKIDWYANIQKYGAIYNTAVMNPFTIKARLIGPNLIDIPNPGIPSSHTLYKTSGFLYYANQGDVLDANASVISSNLLNNISITEQEPNPTYYVTSPQKHEIRYRTYLPFIQGDSCEAVLRSYWHKTRQDQFSTATLTGYLDAVNNGYDLTEAGTHARACVIPTERQGTVALDLYYNLQTNDNFLTATPQGRQDALYAGYKHIRTEGYIFEQQQSGLLALKTYWNPILKVNWSVVEGEESLAEAKGYRFIRVEGYVSINLR
ncbi:MAG: hypothetical protein KIH69_014160 [Anaerolineae bacterium]|nr:hypothetical protein [Anaerolineae bacterium]